MRAMPMTVIDYIAISILIVLIRGGDAWATEVLTAPSHTKGWGRIVKIQRAPTTNVIAIIAGANPFVSIMGAIWQPAASATSWRIV